LRLIQRLDTERTVITSTLMANPSLDSEAILKDSALGGIADQPLRLHDHTGAQNRDLKNRVVIQQQQLDGAASRLIA